MEIRKLKDLATLVSLSKRQVCFQSSEIYGGLGSCWDYGPLGSLMKLNVKKLGGRRWLVDQNIVGIDAAILMAPMVWKASGHVDGFEVTLW